MKLSNLFLITAIVLIVVIPIWVSFAPAKLTRLSPDFTYRADIISSDDFYDIEQQNFSGPLLSKTSFLYEVVSHDGDIRLIRNSFDVRTVDNEPIFTVQRLYGVDGVSGLHQLGKGDRDREGNLYAPRHLSVGEPFTYWHINYDEPAFMRFQEIEHIHGLEVYRYEANYHADQTQDLQFLPGVPDQFGVNLDINLQLWVEPETGHMIKYEDNTTAYYYDQSTKERTHPWNRFHNQYTEDSIRHQVRLAQTHKQNLFFLEVLFPLILLAIAIACLTTWYSCAYYFSDKGVKK